jgi:hypothetical protein
MHVSISKNKIQNPIHDEKNRIQKKEKEVKAKFNVPAI